ncbi:MAG: DUF2207 domain-containing protein [Saprospiraceae bacterium]|nr:DUF2207 domain-containing protein [Saprospiraceae bacterium]
MKTTCYLFLFAIFLTTSVAAESFQIDTYDVTIRVSEAGYFDVTEVIDVRFEEARRGIFRQLPLKAVVDGEHVRMNYSDVAVDHWDYTVYDQKGMRTIRIGHPEKYVRGRQRYILQYRVTGAFLWYEDHSEFYWNLVGNDWPVPITSVTYQVIFPPDVYFSTDDYGIATGPHGSRSADATIEREGQVLSGKTTLPLQPGEGVTIAVRMPPEAIAKPAGYRKPYDPAKDYLAMVPAALAAFLVGFWRRFGKTPHDPSENSIDDVYYPPDGMSAAVVGTIFDHTAHHRDVIALLPEWGNRGLVRIHALDPYSNEPGLSIERIGELEPDAPKHEHVLFDGLFARGDAVMVSDLKNTFYATTGRVQKALKRAVLHERVYDMGAYRMFHSGKFVLLFVLCMAGGIVMLVKTGWIVSGIALMALGVIALVIHFLPPRRSTEGIILQRQLRGLRNFLRDTPPGKMDDLLEDDPDYFSRMLPYAIAFGLDQAWVRACSQREVSAPHWWYIGDTYHAGRRAPLETFSKGFHVESVSSAFTSVPSSSGSSGSGGGFSGSSGGGFGGGGGGSW